MLKYVVLVFSELNNPNSIIYQLTLVSYWLETSHWNFSQTATLHLYNMADKRWKATTAALLSPIFWLQGHIPNQKSLWELFTQDGTDQPHWLMDYSSDWFPGIGYARFRYVGKSDIYINSLWPSDTICRHRSGSTLAQVMACCLTAPSHWLTQYWLLISKALWLSPECNFTKDIPATNH